MPLLAAVALACGGGAEGGEVVGVTDATPITSITNDQWEALAARPIFFGHQSVGRDMMHGVARVLDAHPEIPLRVVSADGPEDVGGTAFIDARIGRNRAPESKSAAFLEWVRAMGDRPGALAMYKFCYVDVNADTDPARLFADYQATIEEARRRHPGLLILHMTLPLHTADEGMGERIRTVLGFPTQTRLNAIRNRYNELLLQTYGGRDPVFDLALLESTRSDGSRAFTRYRGENVYMLAPEWTYDGGHLNDSAKYRAAERLLVFLAQVASAQFETDAATKQLGASLP